MILKVIFDLLFFTNFYTPVEKLITDLTNKDFEQLYPVTNLTAGLNFKRLSDSVVFKSSNQLTRDEAIAFCQRNQALLYTIESKDDLDNLFDQMELEEIWTPIRVTRTGTIVDSNTGYSPVLSTVYGQIIKLPNVQNLDNVHHLTLVKNGNKEFEYKISPDQEPKNLLCEANLSFPYGQESIWQLQAGTALIRNELFMLKWEITNKKQEIISVKSTFETIESGSQVQFDEVTNWEQRLLLKLAPIKETLLETINKWDTLSNELQYVNLMIETRQSIQFMKNILEKVGQPFLHPQAILTTNQIPVEELKTAKIEVYAKETNEIYIKFEINEFSYQNTTNIMDRFRNWLARRSILQITLLEVILSGFCIFSFLVNIIDIMLRVHEKIKGWRNKKNKIRVKQILKNRSSSIPVQSFSDSTRFRPIRIIEQQKCIACQDRKKKVYPTNLHLERSKRRLEGQKNIPMHRRASLLSITTN